MPTDAKASMTLSAHLPRWEAETSPSVMAKTRAVKYAGKTKEIVLGIFLKVL